jgi:hypothetical protein
LPGPLSPPRRNVCAVHPTSPHQERWGAGAIRRPAECAEALCPQTKPARGRARGPDHAATNLRLLLRGQHRRRARVTFPSAGPVTLAQTSFTSLEGVARIVRGLRRPALQLVLEQLHVPRHLLLRLSTPQPSRREGSTTDGPGCDLTITPGTAPHSSSTPMGTT